MSQKSQADLIKHSHVFMGVMGADVRPAVRTAFVRAKEAYEVSGGRATMYIQPNICVRSHVGLMAMRNLLFMIAAQNAATHLLLLESDVLLVGNDIIGRLVKQDCRIVAPYLDQSYIIPNGHPKHKLSSPFYNRAQGLLKVEWTALSCVLIEIGPMRMHGPTPFEEVPIYAAEAYHGLKFACHGLQWWLDTETSAVLLNYPHELWEETDGRRQLPGSKTWGEAKEETRSYKADFEATREAREVLERTMRA